MKRDYERVLTKESLEFLSCLHCTFEVHRQSLLALREERQHEMNVGKFPCFLANTQSIRDDDTWTGAKLAPGLVDRRVELTGPVDRKMLINGLNSQATQYMADFEDSTSPTWDNIMSGHANLIDANLRTISLRAGEKEYKLNGSSSYPTLLVRPRGWHLEESHVLIDGQPISASLFDFGLYFFHNCHQTLRNHHGPYFYLPKLESHLEARLWNSVFNISQDILGVPRGTIRATVLIETILAAFEMDEIIYELREHSAGLNCGRWDYIFSYIKKLQKHREFVLPNRSLVTMQVPFMTAYVKLLVATCHKRSVHAMGGMSAQIPIKDNKAANDAAMEMVFADKVREVRAGHDGTWVAHPDLISVAKAAFDEHMPQPNQLCTGVLNVAMNSLELLAPPAHGAITYSGIVDNISVSLHYLNAWLSGNGCVPINHLMEDAATAEIARSQLWQWLQHRVILASGNLVTKELLSNAIDKVAHEISSSPVALGILKELVFSEKFVDFLTSRCYKEIIEYHYSSKL